MQVKNWQQPRKNGKQEKSPGAPKKVRRRQKQLKNLINKLK